MCYSLITTPFLQLLHGSRFLDVVINIGRTELSSLVPKSASKNKYWPKTTYKYLNRFSLLPAFEIGVQFRRNFGVEPELKRSDTKNNALRVKSFGAASK